jgi:hypothetical protein
MSEWHNAMAAAMAQIPPEVPLSEILTFVKDTRRNTQRCLFCNPTFRPSTAHDCAKLLQSVASLQPTLCYADPKILSFFCDACLAQYQIRTRLDATRHARREAERQAHQAEHEAREARALERFDNGTGTPWSDFNVLCGDWIPDNIRLLLRTMPYREFLQQPFWRVIRRYVISRQRRCFLCAARYNINVHHKTYEHHGYEDLYLDDLVVLCGRCHATHHDKLPKQPEVSSEAEDLTRTSQEVH